MRSFIFLLILIALVTSVYSIMEYTDIDYGCVIPKDAFRCSWVKLDDDCCFPSKEKKDCMQGPATCWKLRAPKIGGKDYYHYYATHRVINK